MDIFPAPLSPKALKILTASAGSGKTFSLTLHYIVLLFSGKNKHREILAVTFTNKATAEMKERIIFVLEGLAKADNNFENYRSLIKNAYPEMTDAEIKEKAAFIFREILHDYGRFSITTIDKFIQKIIRSFAFELGMDAGYKIEMNLKKVVRELSANLHDSLSDNPKLLSWIIDYAKARIASNENWSYERTLLNYAGEIFSESFQEFEDALKSDKHNVFIQGLAQEIQDIRNRFETQLKQGYSNAREIFLRHDLSPADFKNKSRNHLTMLNRPFDMNWLGKIEKYVDQPAEWNKDFTIIEHLYQELNPVLKQMHLFYVDNYPDYLLSDLLRHNFYFLRLMQEMSRLLAQYRVENSLILISDATYLLSGITQGQEDNPSFLWEKMGNRYSHFLFDEFQDTSRKQWGNFFPLLKNAIATFSGKRTEHLIVGDVKQSIYRWRNGDFRVLSEGVEKTLGSDFIQKEELKNNYRSDTNIIQFNNAVFEYGAKWLQELINNKVRSDAGPEFLMGEWEDRGYHKMVLEAYKGNNQTAPEDALKSGGIIDLNFLPVENNRRRASQVKEGALTGTADTLYRWIQEEKRYQPSQIGILVRTKKDALDLIDYLVKDLQERGVKNAYQVISGDALKISANESVQLIINALYLLVSPEGDNAIYKVNCVQLYWQIKARRNSAIATISPSDWLEIGKGDWRDLSEFLPKEFCLNSIRLFEMPVTELVERLISIFGLSTADGDLPYIFAFRDVVASFAKDGERGIPAFLTWWEDENEELTLPSGEGSHIIQVMTIHKSKGLAYDVVMVPFASWEIGSGKRGENFWTLTAGTRFEKLRRIPIPFDKKLNHTPLRLAYWEEVLLKSIDALNELYVALTRARHHLYINIIEKGESELNAFLVSDIIQGAMDNYEKEKGKALELHPDAPVVSAKRRASKHENEWGFSQYPQASHLNIQLNKEVGDQLKRLTTNAYQRLGILVHEALSRLGEAHDLDKILSKMQREGQFRKTELVAVRQAAQKVLDNEQLKKIFSQPFKHLNEQSIIDADGKLYRPDKVLVSLTRTVIIDFKFTSKHHPAHSGQLEKYKELLIKMDYPDVSAYLFYGFSNELIEV